MPVLDIWHPQTYIRYGVLGGVYPLTSVFAQANSLIAVANAMSNFNPGNTLKTAAKTRYS